MDCEKITTLASLDDVDAMLALTLAQANAYQENVQRLREHRELLQARQQAARIDRIVQVLADLAVTPDELRQVRDKYLQNHDVSINLETGEEESISQEVNTNERVTPARRDTRRVIQHASPAEAVINYENFSIIDAPSKYLLDIPVDVIRFFKQNPADKRKDSYIALLHLPKTRQRKCGAAKKGGCIICNRRYSAYGNTTLPLRVMCCACARRTVYVGSRKF